ncbi:hypothetical protein FrCorBMG51_22535 [Protofrankia coriariae]|uniref:DUF6883 domain-containing protein n=1 Tax=Protofrankia coriariae TaxID=1562887 RepID=A0ABR5EZ89_9ACTN|nr:hypothetical protein FrCorBMG51_22535 [Protofrankia coriariae]
MAVLDDRKIEGYAMNPDHPVGRNKYRVIRSATGLDVGDVAEIRRQVLDGVRHGEPILGKRDEYGRRWSVDILLTGPSGTIVVRSGWIVETGSDVPRLTTILFLPRKG